MQLTHLGHSCLLVELGGRRVLIDPGTFSPGFAELRQLDAVVVTHQHADHVDVDRLPALLAANPAARVLVEAQTHDVLAGKGVESEPLRPGAAVDLGGATLTPVGDLHALVHEYVPRIHNAGVVLQAGSPEAPEGPRLFHPGDAYDAEPGAVDVLAVPLSAPWAAVRETIAFVRRIAPALMVPIHEALLAPPGRGMYLNHVGTYGQVPVRDLAGGETWTVDVDSAAAG